MAEVSIIVPFYNSARYIERCVMAICNQTIKNKLELVFVDDGSSDGTADIIRSVLDRERFEGPVKIIINPENIGAARSRIVGLQNATGEYILFCDSDDWQEADMCELLLNKAVGTHSDMVICDFRIIYEGSGEINDYHNCYRPDFLRELLLCHCTGSLWTKLIKRTLFDTVGFEFPTKSYCEDYAYSVQLAMVSENISYVPQILYNYWHHPGSLVTTKDLSRIKNRFFENLDNYYIVARALERYGIADRFSEEIICLKLIIKNSIRPYTWNKVFYKLWNSTFKELDQEIYHSRYVGMRSIVAFYITKFHLYPLLSKLKYAEG